MTKCRITVLRRMANYDLIEEYHHRTVAPCDQFVDGQVFVLDRWDQTPEGFCEWAWQDIHGKLQLVVGEAEFVPEPIKRSGMMIACCTDGFRPVVFKMERLEDNDV